jgi:ubiquinone biosynthesis protein UbiJ
MLSEIVPVVARHLLSQADWARQRLVEHAGKRVRVDLLLETVSLCISDDGYVEAAAHGDGVDLVITITPVVAVKWLSDRQAAWREARVDGDMELAAAISHVIANLRWDYEEDLSRVVGDIAAHRLARTARHISALPAHVMESAARNTAEFLSEESRLLATPLRFEEFANEVDELRDAVARLDKRLEKLAQRLGTSVP